MSTNIEIDTTLALVTDTGADPDALRIFPTGVRVVNSDTRSYYVTVSPLRVLFVLRNGLTFDDMIEMGAVEALIGWDDGSPGFVREDGKKHTKVTVLGPAIGPADVLLSYVLTQAPPMRKEERCISLPMFVWELLTALGDGDPAEGIDRTVVKAYGNS